MLKDEGPKMFMTEIDQLVDDALEMREVSSYKCFVTNLSGLKLDEQGDERAYWAIKDRLEKEPLEWLQDRPGLSHVLGSFFIFGIRHAGHDLCALLPSLPPELLWLILAQGPLRMQHATPPTITSLELLEVIAGLKSHDHEKVRKWAGEFSMTKEMQSPQT